MPLRKFIEGLRLRLRFASASPRMTLSYWLAPCLIFLAGLALYAATLNSGAQAADSGELQAVAVKLGIAHPPGYPLWTMLGWLFSHLPVNPLWGVSLLSAVAAAAALAVNCAAVIQLRPARAGQLAGLVAALALATSTTFWAQATTANIRSLTALFAALLFYCAARAATGRPALSLFALVAGLGVGHHVSLVFIAIVLGAYVVWRERASLTRRGWLRALGVLLATQLVWLYLPLRDAAGALLGPGSLTTLSGFLDHVLARGFGGDMLYFVQAEPALFWDRIALLPTLLRFQFSLPLLAALGIGIALALWRARGLALLLIGVIALHLFITLTYRAPQTVEYALPAWVGLCFLFGVGLAASRAGLPRWIALGAGVFGLIATLMTGRDQAPAFAAANAAITARDDAQRMLLAAPQGAALLAQWHEYTPLLVLQQVEGLRPDVNVIYVYPQGAQPYGETFAAQARAALSRGQPVLSRSLFAREFEAVGIHSAPLPDAPGWRLAAGTDLEATQLFDGRSVVFDGRITLRTQVERQQDDALADGAVRTRHTAFAGQPVTVIAGWHVSGTVREGDSLTVRLPRSDGRLAATADAHVTGDAAQRLTLWLPLDIDPGEYPLLLGAYHVEAGGFRQYRDAQGAEFIPVGTLVIQPARARAATTRPMSAGVVSPMLLGVDYDLGAPNRVRLWTHWQLDGINNAKALTVTVVNAAGTPMATSRVLPPARGDARYFSLAFDIPPERGLGLVVANVTVSLPDYRDGERYVPFGDQMVLTAGRAPAAGRIELSWLSARAIARDYIVSVRYTDAGAHDGVPALGAIPTLKWMPGSRIVDAHPLPPGENKTGSVVVYDSATRQESAGARRTL